jgi:hypothetical protein
MVRVLCRHYCFPQRDNGLTPKLDFGQFWRGFLAAWNSEHRIIFDDLVRPLEHELHAPHIAKGWAFAAIAETTSFLPYFNDLPGYRQAGKVDYPLPEVLILIGSVHGYRAIWREEARSAAEVPAVYEWPARA